MSVRHTGWIIAALGALLVAASTLTPGGGGEPLPITCFWCDRWALQDAILNVLLFIPLGVGIGVMRTRLVPASLAILLTTVLVEGAQLLVVPGRDPSLRDLLTNVVGGLAGHALGLRWAALLFPHKRVAWRAAGWARLAWVAMQLLAGWLLIPSLPERPASVIAGTHVGGFADFRGRVLRSGVATAPSAAASAIEPRHQPLAMVSALIQPGPASRALTPIVTVAQGTDDFPLMLAVRNDDLLFRVRTRAEDVRLRSPMVRFADEIKPWYRTMAPPRDVLSVLAVRTAERASAVVRASSGAVLRADVPVRTTQAWALLWPSGSTLGARPDVASAIWCFLLLVPTGYWSARTGRHRRRLGWLLAGVAAGSGFLVGPLLYSQAWPGVAELVGAAAGLGIGGALGHLSRSILHRPRPAPTMAR